MNIPNIDELVKAEMQHLANCKRKLLDTADWYEQSDLRLAINKSEALLSKYKGNVRDEKLKELLSQQSS